MKLDETAFALATAIVFAIVWLVCSALVLVVPEMMANMSGHMLHSDGQNMVWHLSFVGVLIGGLVWSLVAASIAWLIAALYNKFAAQSDS